MWPVILSLGPVKIYSFGVMMVVAFLAGAFVVWRQGREAHFEEEKLFDVTLVTVFWGLVGARLGYILVHWDSFWGGSAPWWASISIVAYPGLAMAGGLVGGGLGLWGMSRKLGWNFWDTADVFARGWLLAWSIGFMGAFLNGSGYGLQTGLPWGVNFPGVEGVRQPTQIYGLVLGLILFGWSRKWEREYRTYEWYKAGRSEAWPGFVFLASLVGIGLVEAGLTWLQPGWWYWQGIPVAGGIWLAVAVVGGVSLYARAERNLVDDIKFVSAKFRIERRRREPSLRSGGIKRGVDVAYKK